jgi:tRNA U55 pseudouridine synthase TruB
MNTLVRTASGNFTIDKSHTCDELEKLRREDNIKSCLIRVEDLFDYEKIKVKDIQAKRLKDGVRISAEGICEGRLYRVYDNYGNFLSVSECHEGRLTLKKAFWNQ